MDATQRPAVPRAWQALTGTQRDSLLVLARDDRRMASDVADALGYEHRNRASRALADLRDTDLVESTAATDRPGTGKYHRLTDDGRALVETVADRFGEVSHAE